MVYQSLSLTLFHLFTFNVIIDMVGITFSTLVFVFCMSLIFPPTSETGWDLGPFAAALQQISINWCMHG